LFFGISLAQRLARDDESTLALQLNRLRQNHEYDKREGAQMNERFLYTLSRVALVAAAFLAQGSEAFSQAAALTPYTQMLSVRTVGAQEAGRYYVPDKLGYFAQEGLKVTMQPTSGGTQEIQLMLAGQGNSGSVSISSLMQAVQTGLKIKGVFLSSRPHGTSLAVLANGPIKTPADFKGKSIGTFSTTSSRNFDGHAMVAAAGLDPKKDVSWVPVGAGVPALKALQDGSVAGLILWDSAYAALENLGAKLTYFTFPFQDNLLGFTMIATEEMIKNDRDKLIRFLRGLAKGLLFQSVNPEAAACIYMEATGKMKSSSNPRRELSDAVNIVRSTARTTGISPSDKIFGSYPKDKMEFTQEYYVKQGILSTKSPIEAYYVNDDAFYREISDFDRQAIIDQAKSYVGCR
jgi:NitT/TauT family transport system substrate-binding protein